MYVLSIMTPKVVCVYRTDSLARAVTLMEDHTTHHLIVVEADGSLVGILSDRDCKAALASPFTGYDEGYALSHAERINVGRIMSPAPICVTPQTSVQEAAALMLEKHFHALPVLHDSSVIGIVTSTDLLRVLASLQEIVTA